MPRELLPQIETIRSLRLLRVVRNAKKQLAIDNAPPTKSAGFYWIYTNYSQPDLERQLAPACCNAVDIGLLSRLHCGLANTCSIRPEGFRLVYSGIAGTGTGLRERIHQHFNGGQGTGSLAILRTGLDDLEQWRVSYVSIETPEPNKPDIAAQYDDVAVHIERIWRLEYGWPILCIK